MAVQQFERKGWSQQHSWSTNEKETEENKTVHTKA